MLNKKKLTVVLPAHNALKTHEITCLEIIFTIPDEVILIDDISEAETI